MTIKTGVRGDDGDNDDRRRLVGDVHSLINKRQSLLDQNFKGIHPVYCVCRTCVTTGRGPMDALQEAIDHINKE